MAGEEEEEEVEVEEEEEEEGVVRDARGRVEEALAKERDRA